MHMHEIFQDILAKIANNKPHIILEKAEQEGKRSQQK